METFRPPVWRVIGDVWEIDPFDGPLIGSYQLPVGTYGQTLTIFRQNALCDGIVVVRRSSQIEAVVYLVNGLT